MPEFKITYFGLHGRASAMRFMLALSKADWENCVVTGEQWKELKPKYGGLPVVHLAGSETWLDESVPTSRYIAKRVGYYPEDATVAWRTDVVVD